MHSRSFLLIALILGFGLLGGCSSPESKERLDTVLCWLRPSCLPSHSSPAQTPNTSNASEPSPVQPKAAKIRQDTPTKAPSVPCLISAKATISGSKPLLTVSYDEPTTNANGQALRNLDKTTIYHDLGKGLVKYKDIPATSRQGGGRIQEKVSFTLGEGDTLQTIICVTATNTSGQES